MRHLLDLNDLLEEELCHVYEAETKLLEFLDELIPRAKQGPLLDWMLAYRGIVENHSSVVRKIFYNLFLPISPEGKSVVEEIIAEYHSEVRRTVDEDIREEEVILALAHIIHYKIASYGTLHIHAKALKYWDEAIGLHIALAQEKEMEANLTFLIEKHSVFLSDWYSL